MPAALLSWLELELELELELAGVSSSFSSLSTGSSGMEVGSSSLRAPLTPSMLGLLRQPAGPAEPTQHTHNTKQTAELEPASSLLTEQSQRRS